MDAGVERVRNRANVTSAGTEFEWPAGLLALALTRTPFSLPSPRAALILLSLSIHPAMIKPNLGWISRGGADYG